MYGLYIAVLKRTGNSSTKFVQVQQRNLCIRNVVAFSTRWNHHNFTQTVKFMKIQFCNKILHKYTLFVRLHLQLTPDVTWHVTKMQTTPNTASISWSNSEPNIRPKAAPVSPTRKLCKKTRLQDPWISTTAQANTNMTPVWTMRMGIVLSRWEIRTSGYVAPVQMVRDRVPLFLSWMWNRPATVERTKQELERKGRNF